MSATLLLLCYFSNKCKLGSTSRLFLYKCWNSMIFHDLMVVDVSFHDFPPWKNIFRNSRIFHGFQKTQEPCIMKSWFFFNKIFACHFKFKTANILQFGELLLTILFCLPSCASPSLAVRTGHYIEDIMGKGLNMITRLITLILL